MLAAVMEQGFMMKSSGCGILRDNHRVNRGSNEMLKQNRDRTGTEQEQIGKKRT
jgi:hypothetical protein